MDNQRKLTKNLSIAGLILNVLSLIVGAIFLWWFISKLLKGSNSMTWVYLYIVISIISAMCIAKFVILIILAAKTTSSGNKLLFMIGILFIGIWPFDFIGFILELRISRKSNVSANWNGPQMPSNNSNASIPPMPQY